MDMPGHRRLSQLPDEMLSFNILKSTGPNIISPRLGTLIIQRRKPVETPHFIALTSRGAVPHISQDTLRDNTNVKGV
jgi:queuine tRNA-ribosyltransferase subunit QTRTD1